jgi:hypothetical protein
MTRRLVPVALSVIAMLQLGGCVVEGTLAPDGGAVMTVSYRTLGGEGKLDTERKRMESPNVTITSASIDEKGQVTFGLKVKNVTQLSASKFFERTKVTLTDGSDGTKALVAKVVNPKRVEFPPNVLEHFAKETKVSITLPGEITKSNATATKDQTATWNVPMQDMLGAPEVTLEVTFKAPAKKEG